MNCSSSGCELIALASSIAITIGKEFDSNELALLGSFFTALGDNLSIISASKALNENNKNSC